MNLIAKSQLTTRQLTLLESEMQNRRKSVGVAYALWFFGWLFAGQKFYLRNYLWGFIYLFTLSLLGFGSLWDLFTLPSQVVALNVKIERDVLNEIVGLGLAIDNA